jgi:hypothetical protein
MGVKKAIEDLNAPFNKSHNQGDAHDAASPTDDSRQARDGAVSMPMPIMIK